jgi:hypothetical protein
MSDGSGPKRSVVERVNDVAGALAAMRKAVQQALLRHKRLGNPVAVWRDGAVHWIPPEEICVPSEDGE